MRAPTVLPALVPLACAVAAALVVACAPSGAGPDAGGDDEDDAGASTDDAGASAADDAGARADAGTTGDAGVVGDAGPPYAPAPGTTWQWQLSGLPLDTTVDAAMYDVDLFETEAATIDALHGDGRVVVCYLSAGTYEPYRPDVSGLPSSVKGNALDPPFGDELWLDVRAEEVRELLRGRLDLAVTKGCDAVEPDNVDGYANDPGFPFTAADQLAFNRFVANEAHARGLSVGLKNDLDQLADLVDSFDWALNEECFTYDECDAYTDTFIAAGKAVFHAEYVEAAELGAVCAVTAPLGLSTIVKNIELDAYRLACP